MSKPMRCFEFLIDNDDTCRVTYRTIYARNIDEARTAMRRQCRGKDLVMEGWEIDPNQGGDE